MNSLAKLRLYSHILRTLGIVFLAAGLFSCKPERKKVDVSQVDVNVSAQRFEEDLASHYSDFSYLSNKYGSFFTLFVKRLVPFHTDDTTALKHMLKNFVNDADIKNIYADSRKLYPDFTKENAQITDAFRHYKYYFPAKVIPQPITLITGFNYGIVAVDSVLGIGLDMYLGDTSRFYPGLQFSAYKIRRMRREYIAPDAMRGWLQSEWEQDAGQADFLSALIYQGKILYALDAMLPGVPDTIKTGYTTTQLKWCEQNEKDIWSFFVDHSLLYVSDQGQIAKYLGEGPTTNGFPKESPGNIGQWLGWKVIQSYMNTNSGVTLAQLLNDNDYKKIFNNSKYKPRK
jgi:hypothetical protein